MPKALAIEGTNHTVSLHRLEPAVLDAIRGSDGVRKLKPMWVNRAGPGPVRLEIREGEFPWLVEAHLFIGSGKRCCRIYVEKDTELEQFRRMLQATLTKLGVEVLLLRGEAHMHVTETNNAVYEPSIEERWVRCLLIYEQVHEFKKIEDQEIELELKLEELRNKKAEARQKALETKRQLD